MEDSLVPLVNDPLVTSQAGRRAEGAATNATGELLTVGKTHRRDTGEIRQELGIKCGAQPTRNQRVTRTRIK